MYAIRDNSGVIQGHTLTDNGDPIDASSQEWADYLASQLAVDPTKTRDDKLAALVHDFGDGRVIQCRPHPYPDNSNMRNAIEQMERRGESSRGWYAADNTWVTVTANELKDAVVSGQDQSDKVWEDFAIEVSA